MTWSNFLLVWPNMFLHSIANALFLKWKIVRYTNIYGKLFFSIVKSIFVIALFFLKLHSGQYFIEFNMGMNWKVQMIMSYLKLMTFLSMRFKHCITNEKKKVRVGQFGNLCFGFVLLILDTIVFNLVFHLVFLLSREAIHFLV